MIHSHLPLFSRWFLPFLFALLLRFVCFNVFRIFSRLSVKKGAAAGKKPVKKGKPAKDPNKPKRPASAFFVFMYDFALL